MLPSEVLDGSVTNTTSSYPYVSVGPVDFARENFISVCQKDYYYNESSTPPQLLSEVDQCTNQYGTIWTLAGFVLLFAAMVVAGTKLISRRWGH